MLVPDSDQLGTLPDLAGPHRIAYGTGPARELAFSGPIEEVGGAIGQCDGSVIAAAGTDDHLPAVGIPRNLRIAKHHDVARRLDAIDEWALLPGVPCQIVGLRSPDLAEVKVVKLNARVEDRCPASIVYGETA